MRADYLYTLFAVYCKVFVKQIIIVKPRQTEPPDFCSLFKARSQKLLEKSGSYYFYARILYCTAVYRTVHCIEDIQRFKRTNKGSGKLTGVKFAVSEFYKRSAVLVPVILLFYYSRLVQRILIQTRKQRERIRSYNSGSVVISAENCVSRVILTF